MKRRRHGSTFLILRMGKGETEALRGAGPCPGTPVDFRWPSRSACPAHCTVFVPRPRPGAGFGGKVARRREGPACQGRAGLGSLLAAPEPRQPPTLKIKSVTPDTAGHQSQEAAGGAVRAPARPPPPGSPPPLRPCHPRGMPAPAACSTGVPERPRRRACGPPRRRRPSSRTSWVACKGTLPFGVLTCEMERRLYA